MAHHRFDVADANAIDLRHSGQLLAATNGATLVDLPERMGHSTVNAAMAYDHASRDNGRSIAERMNAQRATVIDINSRRQGTSLMRGQTEYAPPSVGRRGGFCVIPQNETPAASRIESGEADAGDC